MRKLLLLILLVNSLSNSSLFAQVPSYVPTNGLLAWYGMNSSPNDDSGNNNHAVNNGATYYSDRFGNIGAAGYFNGTNSYMVVQNPSFTFSDTGDFTYSFWIRKEVQPSAGIVLMTGVNTTGVFITILQGGSQTTFGTNKQQSAWIYISCPHTLNVWDHYVCSYNSNAMKLYKNGNLESTGTFNHTGTFAQNVPLFIGKGIASGNFLGGIDDIGVWGRELSAIEVLDLYNNSVTSLNEFQTNTDGSLLFPNPVDHELRIQSKTSLLNKPYSIFNCYGQSIEKGVFTEENPVLNTTKLTKGIYFLQINNQEHLKFIKQ
jgi:hypothetical protein